MPVTIPPITRRRFLASTVAAAAGVAVGGMGGCARDEEAVDWPAVTPITAARDPNRVALLSDIHIAVDPGRRAWGVNMADHLRQAVGEVLAADATAAAPGGGPARVIVNGDCAYNWGEIGDYEQMLKLIRPLLAAGLPVHLALGNHDSRDRLAKAAPQRQPVLADRRVTLVPGPRADFILLDSLEETNAIPGALGEEQLVWLRQTLDDPSRAGKPTIVMVHHQPVKGGRGSGLEDTAALMETILPRRQVKALVFGHTHVWSHQRVDGMHLVNLPAVAYVFEKGQPSGWTDCLIGERGAKLTMHALDKGHRANGQVLELDWRA